MFSKAFCDTELHNVEYLFGDIFQHGISLVTKYLTQETLPDDKTDRLLLRKLLDIKKEGKSINLEPQKLTETELAVLLANHLFGKLATYNNYVIDKSFGRKGDEQCVCDDKSCKMTVCEINGRPIDKIFRKYAWSIMDTFFLCGYCGLLFDDDNEGQRHESEHELYYDGEKGATSHSKTDQEHHCHHCDKVMSNVHDLVFHELAHDLDQMDYSGEGPWSPLIPNSTCEPMEEDHVADQEMAPESMETDEASTSTRTNSSQIGFGSVKKIPYTIQKVGERTIMKN
uniref:C2H2-type domain-containing protein n=1 Tax=Magallana gigas TaxID=29159 RepID=K1PSD8_MAGGI